MVGSRGLGALHRSKMRLSLPPISDGKYGPSVEEVNELSCSSETRCETHYSSLERAPLGAFQQAPRFAQIGRA